MTNAIEVDGISRVFAQAGSEPVVALDDVTVSVGEGEIVGLLGVNGAGKTTLTKILATLLLPSRGRARVAGFDVTRQTAEVRKRIGVVLGGDRGLYTRISGRDNLMFFGMLAGVARRDLRTRVPGMLELVHLSEAADRRVETIPRACASVCTWRSASSPDPASCSSTSRPSASTQPKRSVCGAPSPGCEAMASPFC